MHMEWRDDRSERQKREEYPDSGTIVKCAEDVIEQKSMFELRICHILNFYFDRKFRPTFYYKHDGHFCGATDSVTDYDEAVRLGREWIDKEIARLDEAIRQHDEAVAKHEAGEPV
jgi:hypothetical protein